MKKRILSCFTAVMLLIGFLPIRAMANDLPGEGKFIYVRDDGDDSNTGTDEDNPYLTLSKAVTAAESGDTIIVLSDLEMKECARFYDKEITVKSGDDGPYTVTRGRNFATQSDSARQEYNPAMIEMQTTDSSASLTIANIIFDDAGQHEGDVFAQAVSGDGGDDNTVYVQDAIIASNATVSSTIILGEGAVLRNFGGESAVRVSNLANLIMKSGSVIEDTDMVTRGNDNDAKEAGKGPAGAVWIQGGSFEMEDGAKIKNINGRAVYVDGGEATVGGTISGISGNKNMWQSNDGIGIHIRNTDASATLTSTAVIKDISGGGSAIYVTGKDNKVTTEPQSVIKDLTNTIGIYCGSKSEAQLSGEITGLNGGNALSINDGAEAVLEEDGNIHDNKCGTAVVYLRADAQFTIRGKINDNNSIGNCAALYIVTNGGSSHATLEDGGEICNNINNGSKYGAAVEVQQGECSFTMEGGKITGNEGPFGAIQVHKGSPVFIMNGGEVTDNISTSGGEAGIYVENGTPTVKLNNGKAQSITLKENVSAQTDKGNIYVSDSFDLESGYVTMLQDNKTVIPDDNSLDIKLGNAKTEAVEVLKTESESKGWSNSPLGSFWMQRDGSAALEISGLSPDTGLPVYLLVTETNESGKPDGTGVDIYYVEDESGIITVTIPDKGYENGCVMAFFQPTNDSGTVVITTTVPVLREEEAASNYNIPYKAQYTMSQSLLTQLKTVAAASTGTGTDIEFNFVVKLDNRLTAKKDNAGKFIYDFDGSGVIAEKPEEISVSPDGHTIEVPCKLTDDWKTNIQSLDTLVMDLYGTGVLDANDFGNGGVINTTGYIEAKLSILGNILIPANICKTNMVGLTRYTVTYEAGEGSGNNYTESYIEGKSFETKNIGDLGFTAPDKKVFNGWKWYEVKGTRRTELKNKPDTVTGNLAAVAQWKKKSDGEITKYYTLKYESNGGTEYRNEDYPEGTKAVLGKVPVKEGYIFTGWYDSEDLENKISNILMVGNKTVYAGWEKKTNDTGNNSFDVPEKLNGEEHTAYIVGGSDGLIRPNDKITRAEVATIFFRLLKDDIRNKNYIKTNGFNDIYAEDWYNTAISTVANAGIISGYPDGCF